MPYMLAYTEEAREALKAMEPPLRKTCLNTIFRLLEDPRMKPAAPLNHSDPEGAWLIPLAAAVMASYSIQDGALVVSIIDVFDASLIEE